VNTRNSGEERKKYTSHLALHWLLHLVAGATLCSQRRFAETPRENPQGLPQTSHKGDKAMPLINKAPAIVTLEVKIEEPVKQLLEDYARFIECTPDHVVNSVIKKNLWRDPDYRKWREQRRVQSLDSAKSAASSQE
jgi:hypothetical protein